MIKNNSNYDFTTMLDEAQSKLERQFASMKSLREHGKLILGSSSIIVSLFTLFKISSTYVKTEFIFCYLLLVGFMALSYCLLMYFSVKATLPYPLEHALEPTWKTYVEAFKDENDRTILERRVFAYLKAINNNETMLLQYYGVSKKLNWYMTMVIISIIFTALFIPFMQA